MNYLLVFIGGGLGAILRFFLSSWVGARVRNHADNYYQWLGGGNGVRTIIDNFPFGTFFINCLGALLIGMMVEFLSLGFAGSRAMGDMMRYFLIVGVLGGFTTFSAFSLESYLLWVKGYYGVMALYVGLSVICTIGLVWLATYCWRWIL